GRRPAGAVRHDYVHRLLVARGARRAHRTGARADGHRGPVGLSGSAGAFGDALRAAFGADRVHADAPLAPLTTFKVGGDADWLVETRSSDEIVAALRLAHAARVGVTILGGGSNVLVADAGVRGLVIRPRGGAIARLDARRIRADAA